VQLDDVHAKKKVAATGLCLSADSSKCVRGGGRISKNYRLGCRPSLDCCNIFGLVFFIAKQRTDVEKDV